MRIERFARRTTLSGLIVGVALTAMTGVALALAYTVVYGTAGNDAINESGKTGYFHIYGFQGSDKITTGTGDITIQHGFPVINGYDLVYGDGQCSQTPPNNDSYCVHPLPWEPQPWTDAASATDTLAGGVGPDQLIGGGGSNVITGSQTYDVITAGPHKNTITGSLLGSTIWANTAGSQSTITLKASFGSSGYDGLPGLPNVVDVFNSTSGDVVTCSSTKNFDVVYADKGDTIKNCYLVINSAPPLPPSSGVLEQPGLPPARSGTTTARELQRYAERLVRFAHIEKARTPGGARG